MKEKLNNTCLTINLHLMSTTITIKGEGFHKSHQNDEKVEMNQSRTLSQSFGSLIDDCCKNVKQYCDNNPNKTYQFIDQSFLFDSDNTGLGKIPPIRKVKFIGNAKNQLKKPIILCKSVDASHQQQKMTQKQSKTQIKIQQDGEGKIRQPGVQPNYQNAFKKKAFFNPILINEKVASNINTYLIQYRRILNEGHSAIKEAKSNKIKQKLQVKFRKTPQTRWSAILFILKMMQSRCPAIKVVLEKQSSSRSQISLELILTGQAFRKFVCSYLIKISELKTSWQDLQRKSDIFQLLQSYLSQKIFNLYGIKLQQFMVTEARLVDNLTIKVEWNMQNPQIILQNDEATKNIQVKPFFENLYISIDQFDQKKGISSFKENSSSIYSRGNAPYFPPQRCNRFSLKVVDKFDEGNNEWITMGHPNQWYVSYVGIKNKKSNEKETKISLKAPKIDELKIREFATGSKQISCTPYMWNALQDTYETQVNGKIYSLVFQCRVNQKKVQIAGMQQDWMINELSDIRPYGMILVEKEVKDQYPKPQSQFQKLFYAQWVNKMKQGKDKQKLIKKIQKEPAKQISIVTSKKVSH